MSKQKNELVVVIIQRGEAEAVIEAAIEAGASGATTVYGRGRGVRENLGVLGSLIQPEKEVVMVVVPEQIADKVMAAVGKAGRVDEPGMGLVFMVPLSCVLGLPEMP
jgi:nitrogen regulatory protein PII